MTVTVRFTMPEGLEELRDTLQAGWPARREALHATGVPLNEGDDDDPGDQADDIDADPAAADVVDDVPAGDPPSSGVDWSSPEAAQAIGSVLQNVLNERDEQTRLRESQPAPFDFSQVDALDGESLAAAMRQVVTEALAPIMPVVQSVQNRESRDWADQQLEQHAVPTEDRDTILHFAAGIGAAAQAQGAKADPGALIQQAARTVAERDKRVADAAVEKYKADLKADLIAKSGAPGQPPRAGGSAVDIEPTSGTLVEAARRFSERHQLAS